jgi:hypothetical protein
MKRYRLKNFYVHLPDSKKDVFLRDILLLYWLDPYPYSILFISLGVVFWWRFGFFSLRWVIFAFLFWCVMYLFVWISLLVTYRPFLKK